MKVLHTLLFLFSLQTVFAQSNPQDNLNNYLKKYGINITPKIASNGSKSLFEVKKIPSTSTILSSEDYQRLFNTQKQGLYNMQLNTMPCKIPKLEPNFMPIAPGDKTMKYLAGLEKKPGKMPHLAYAK